MEEEPEVLVLCAVEDEHQNPAYVYLALSRARLDEFQRARLRGAVELSTFGRIILTGEGDKPPPAIAECLALVWSGSPILTIP
jgi:hypothetical protein